MSDPFIGEIRMFGGSFAPAGWAFCDGQLVAISQNDALFTLIGTTYGGDGQQTFGLPDLQGRMPVHAGQGPGISQNYQLGENSGVESVTLTVQQIPVHNHAFVCSTANATSVTPADSIPATNTINQYSAVAGPQPMGAMMVPTGGSQPHDNMMPFLVLSFIISLFGIFPSQN